MSQSAVSAKGLYSLDFKAVDIEITTEEGELSK